MTLIACTLNYKRPFLIGDLLVSSRDAKKSIQLPTNTIDITKYLPANNSFAVDLYQKIYIINSHTAIALAGNIMEMTSFLEEFKIRCSYYEFINEPEIRNFIADYDLENNFKESAFFILLMRREGNSILVNQFWSPNHLWSNVKSDIFEEVYACGTGKEEFLHQASEQQTFETTSEKGENFHATGANLNFIAKLLAAERFSLYTLKDNWGGGFETIFFNGHSFSKIDQIAYIICYAQFDEKGEFDLPFPQLIQYYQYHKDVLFITSIEIKNWRREENNDQIKLKSRNFQVAVFPVPRLDLKAGSSIELPPSFSFYTQKLGFGYAIVKNNNGIFAPSTFIESSMSVNYQDREYLELSLDKEMANFIKDGAKKAFPNL